MRQGGYRVNNLVGINEAFANLDQATAEDRAAVNNLTDANTHLAIQVSKEANHMANKDTNIETMTKLIQQIQGEIKTLKTKQAGKITKIPDSSSYKKENWWRNIYC